MLKKRYRLKKIKEFNYMFRNGKRDNTPCLSMITTRAYLPYSRYGISISSKIGNAVVRNKVKRRIRSAIWRYNSLNNTQSKRNIIFVARPGIEKMAYNEICDVIDKLLNKIQ